VASSMTIASSARRWIEPFSDVHMRIIDLIADDDRVIGRFARSGTHGGEWLGHAPQVGASPTSRRSTSSASMANGSCTTEALRRRLDTDTDRTALPSATCRGVATSPRCALLRGRAALACPSLCYASSSGYLFDVAWLVRDSSTVKAPPAYAPGHINIAARFHTGGGLPTHQRRCCIVGSHGALCRSVVTATPSDRRGELVEGDRDS